MRERHQAITKDGPVKRKYCRHCGRELHAGFRGRVGTCCGGGTPLKPPPQVARVKGTIPLRPGVHGEPRYGGGGKTKE